MKQSGNFQNYKKVFFYLLVAFIVLLIAILVIFTNNKSTNEPIVDVEKTDRIEKLHLFGNKEIIIEQGEKYIEPGYYALSSTGELKTDDVIVTPDVFDSSIPGTYYINYVIGNKIETRTVIVKEKESKENEESILTLELKGDSTVILEEGNEYVEPGYTATDTIDGDLTNDVNVEENINTLVPGTYTITYEVQNSSGDKITKTRTVIVKETTLNVELKTNLNSNYTNKNIIVTINVDGNNFLYLKYPDGTISNEKKSTYTITKNGYYEFLIYDKNNHFITKELNVTEIDKEGPSGTCSLVNKNGKSTITVKADDNLSGIYNYKYYGNDKLLKTDSNSIYSSNTTYKSSYVLVSDNASNTSKINCTVSNKTTIVNKYDYLEMHFIVSGYNDDAILIRTGEATILIDTGRKGAEKRVIPYLQGLGVKTIDAIIGSHPHYNHIQAQAFIIENFKVKQSLYSVDLNTCVSKHYCESKDVLYIKDAIKKNNIPMKVTKAGDKITIGDMTLYFLGPYKLNNTSKYMQNANSSIFILKYKNNTFMFTGDTGGTPFTYAKLKPYADKLKISLNVDMLKYPHHGNAGIETTLLNAIKPEYIIIPNYKYGKYPTSSNKTKIKNTRAKIYQNASDGNIVLKSDGKNITVKKNQSASSYKR